MVLYVFNKRGSLALSINDILNSNIEILIVI